MKKLTLFLAIAYCTAAHSQKNYKDEPDILKDAKWALAYNDTTGKEVNYIYKTVLLKKANIYQFWVKSKTKDAITVSGNFYKDIVTLRMFVLNCNTGEVSNPPMLVSYSTTGKLLDLYKGTEETAWKSPLSADREICSYACSYYASEIK